MEKILISTIIVASMVVIIPIVVKLFFQYLIAAAIISPPFGNDKYFCKIIPCLIKQFQNMQACEHLTEKITFSK